MVEPSLLASTSNNSTVAPAPEFFYDDNEMYPYCKEFFCAQYFDNARIISHCIMFGRLAIALLILLLGTKMNKDFMRTVTMAIFIPITLNELFTLYREAMYFASFFCESEEDLVNFTITFSSWTEALEEPFYSYIHYNCLVMMVLILHCCHLAYREGDAINPFPINTICMIMQIIPFFLCILKSLEGDASVALKVISVISRVTTIICCVAVTLQILYSFYLVTRLLPYDHAASVDMQLRDARSRLIWTLIYMIIPYVCLVPFAVESVAWIVAMGRTEDPTLKSMQILTEVLMYMINVYRSTWMVLLTMICLPPYRRAVPLLFCCCAFCKVKVDPLPRKPVETSLMYKYADA